METEVENVPFMVRINEHFIDFADKVSSGMGTPLNIILWLAAVISWFLLFAFNPGLQNSNFMPAWFTSLPFNLPLNLITTLAELYIGFLVAAAANRVERHNRVLQQQQMEMIARIEQTDEDADREIHTTEDHLLGQDTQIKEILSRIERVEGLILDYLKANPDALALSGSPLPMKIPTRRRVKGQSIDE